MKENPKEIVKIAIQEQIEIDDYIMELKLKKKKLNEVIYNYMKLKQILSVEGVNFYAVLKKEGVEIKLNKEEKDL